MKAAAVAMLGAVIVLACACGRVAPVGGVTASPSPTPTLTGISPALPASAERPPVAAAPGSTPMTPPARAGAALAFDPVSDQLLLIGGMDNPLHPSQSAIVPGRDFWGWRPTTGWTLLTPEIVPPVGYLSAMVWDAATRRIVLVSQSDVTVWTWDGATWSPANGGGLQIDELGGAAYDSKLDTVRVLGRSPQGAVESMWSWNGSAWRVDATPMSWREQAAVAYDAARGDLVVYGGFGNGDTSTWLFDGSAWKRLTTTAAPSTNQSSAAYDPVRGEVVMHVSNGETWTWDGVNWRIRSTAGPGVRRDESMAFDPALGEVVLFGGKVPQGAEEVYMNDLWAWNGTHWDQVQ